MSPYEKAFATTVDLICIPIAILSEGYVISKLWAWFVVPTFALPTLTINTAIGICLLWGLISIKRKDWWPLQDEDEKEVAAEITKAIYPCLMPWIGMLTGWVVLAFK